MAGLIQQNRPQPAAPAQQAQRPDTDDSGAPDTNNPAYQQALSLLHDVLYKQDAAKQVAQSLRNGPDGAAALADTAYQMVVTIDDKTRGNVPDELLIALAAEVLGEVADIAKAAGIKVDGKMIGEAMKQMLLRYMRENGVDTGEVEQAMSDNINQDKLDAGLNSMMGAQS
jgi:hypothetical protein